MSPRRRQRNATGMLRRMSTEPSPSNHARATLLVVMGVSGCGKTSVGRRVATAQGWAFLEGDTLHPPANVAKMHAGHPLDDDDRRPWLDAIGRWMDDREAAGQSAVIACSALKRCYREHLRRGRPGVLFAWLDVRRAELERRLHQRPAHFMPASLLDSQLATLEPPAADEPAFTVDANHDLDTTVGLVLNKLNTY